VEEAKPGAWTIGAAAAGNLTPSGGLMPRNHRLDFDFYFRKFSDLQFIWI
jgi:hypothetical protein